ncbi:MAG: sugar phosphate nucleotidyltransferase, partial [Armatimonadota bacterium]
GDCFLVAYCDGLSDIDFRHLVRFHRSHDRIATLTAVRAPCQFGILRLDETDRVSAFEEKPLLKDWVNGGFYVFDLGVLDYLRDDDMLESDTLPRLVEAGQLAAYRHTGFWACLDTYKDAAYLSELWESGRAPWRTWEP